jgi:hypothetical protein
MKMMFYSIVLILMCTYLFANENGDLSGEIYPTENVKVLEVLEKIEQLEKDGDKTYWNKITEVKPKDAADQYCYVDLYTPEYCRKYSRPGHAFKTPGKVCLTKNGEWEVR